MLLSLSFIKKFRHPSLVDSCFFEQQCIKHFKFETEEIEMNTPKLEHSNTLKDMFSNITF